MKIQNNPLPYLKRFLLIFAFGALTNSTLAHQNKPLGLGVVLGEPSGISARQWLSTDEALNFSLAYSLDKFLFASVDYTWQFSHILRIQDAHLHPYIGVGAGIAFAGGAQGSPFSGENSSSVGVGIRVPLGIEWIISGGRLGVFLEFVPGIGIVPGTFGFANGGVGIRYYF